jgi:Tat protein secretion system quality control protein TatD with DNase activity
VHLFDYDDKQLEKVIDESLKNNIKYLINNSVDVKSFNKVMLLSQLHKNIIPSFGIHPWYVLD